MSESSSTDAAVLHREARRRRILENSQNRLRSITGRADSSPEEESKGETCFRIHPDEFRYANQNDIFRELSPATSTPVDASKEFTSLGGSFEQIVADGDKIKIQSEIEKSYFECFLKKRYHYVVLSVVVRFLLFCQLGFLIYNNVICPFLIVKLMECMLVQDTVMLQKPNFLSLVASVSKGSIIPHLCKAYSIIKMIASDFFLYMFVFVLSDKLFIVIQELHNM